MRLFVGVALMAIVAEGFVPNIGGIEKRINVREKSTARFAVPIIDDWKILKDGSIKGTVTGHRKWKNGKIITTSPLKSPGKAGKDSIVSTTSGSRYKLAKPAAGGVAPAGGGTALGAAAFAAAAISFFVSDSAGIQATPVPFLSGALENSKNLIDLKSMVKVPEGNQARLKQENMLKATVAVDKADRIAEKMATTKEHLAAVAEARNERLASVRVEPKLFPSSLERSLKAEEAEVAEATKIEVNKIQDEATQMIEEIAPAVPVMKAESSIQTPPVVQQEEEESLGSKTDIVPTIDSRVQIGAAFFAAGGVAAAAVAAKPEGLKSLSTSSKSTTSSDAEPIDPTSDDLDFSPIDIMMEADSVEASLVAESVGATPTTPWTPSSLTAEIDFRPPTDLDFVGYAVEVEEADIPIASNVGAGVDRLKTNLDLGLERAHEWQQNELQSVMSKLESTKVASSVPGPLEVVVPGAPAEPAPGVVYGDEAFAHLVPATALFSSGSSFAENATESTTPSGSYLDSLSSESSVPDAEDSMEDTLHEEMTVGGSDLTSVVEGTTEEALDKETTTTTSDLTAVMENKMDEATEEETATSGSDDAESLSSRSDFVEETIEQLLEEQTPARFTTTTASDDGPDIDIHVVSDDSGTSVVEDTIQEPRDEDATATTLDESDLLADTLSSSSGPSFVEDSIEEILEEETPARFTTATTTNGGSDLDADLPATEAEPSVERQETVPGTSIPASSGVKAVTADVPGGFFSSALTDDSVFMNTVSETEPSIRGELPSSSNVASGTSFVSPTESTTEVLETPGTMEGSLAESSPPASAAIGVSELDVGDFESFSVRRAKRMAERERRRRWHSNSMDSPDMLRPQTVSARPSFTPNRNISPISEVRAPLEVVEEGTSAEASQETSYSTDGTKPLNQATALYSSATAQQDPVSTATKIERLKVELKLADEWKTETSMNGFKPAPPTHNGYEPVDDPLKDLGKVPPSVEASRPRMPEPPTMSAPKFPTASGASLPLSEKMRRLKNELELSRKFLDEL